MIVIEDYFQSQKNIENPLLCIITEVKSKQELIVFRYNCFKIQVYHLHTFLQLDCPQNTIYKRYKDFQSLHLSLENEFPYYFLPSLPPKRLMNKMIPSAEFNEN